MTAQYGWVLVHIGALRFQCWMRVSWVWCSMSSVLGADEPMSLADAAAGGDLSSGRGAQPRRCKLVDSPDRRSCALFHELRLGADRVVPQPQSPLSCRSPPFPFPAFFPVPRALPRAVVRAVLAQC